MFAVVTLATNRMSEIFQVMLKSHMTISGLWTTILLCAFYQNIAFRKCNGQFYPSDMIFKLNTKFF